jgi:hypothetical protein
MGLVYSSARFLNEDVLLVEFSIMMDAPQGMVFIRNLPGPLGADAGGPFGFDAEQPFNISVVQEGRLVVIGSHVHDASTGQRLTLPRGRRYHPQLGQQAEGSRLVPLHHSLLVDLAADKPIQLGQLAGSLVRIDPPGARESETWVALDFDNRIAVLRRADASLSADLLQKWCQVITRGKLDETGRFRKLDESTWEKARLELAQLLDANPQAQLLRSAVTDPFYWLRQEIKEMEPRDPAATLVLLDRLVAADPAWQSYSQRAALHARLQHADLAIQDELEAARLAGERYWLGGSSITDWQVAALSVQAPGAPRQQYERALRWVEARTGAGVADEGVVPLGHYRPRRNVILGLALLRLGRAADALSELLRSELPELSQAARMLMSPWNVLASVPSAHSFDPVDLPVRAMCHHHLGHPQQARACLGQARSELLKKADTDQCFALLREAEVLIEGKSQR